MERDPEKNANSARASPVQIHILTDARLPRGRSKTLMADTLQETIVDFLNTTGTASLVADNSTCETCGAIVEYRPFTFCYRGQSWEVCLPICVKCKRTRPSLAYEA